MKALFLFILILTCGCSTMANFAKGYAAADARHRSTTVNCTSTNISGYSVQTTCNSD